MFVDFSDWKIEKEFFPLILSTTNTQEGNEGVDLMSEFNGKMDKQRWAENTFCVHFSVLLFIKSVNHKVQLWNLPISIDYQNLIRPRKQYVH